MILSTAVLLFVQEAATIKAFRLIPHHDHKAQAVMGGRMNRGRETSMRREVEHHPAVQTDERKEAPRVLRQEATGARSQKHAGLRIDVKKMLKAAIVLCGINVTAPVAALARRKPAFRIKWPEA